MNDMDEKLSKAIRSRLDNYINKCSNLKDHSRIIPIDDIGRKALKAYFRRTPSASPLDAKLLSVI
jgi:t-SNARE complex subunit (syntaxin)